MDEIKINLEAGLLLTHFLQRKLTTHEKIAALKSAAAMLETILAIEYTMEMMSRTLNSNKEPIH